MVARLPLPLLLLAALPAMALAKQGGAPAPLGPFASIGRVDGAAVLTVDSSGGADFLDLPPAVAAAGDGDLLLVQPSPRPYSGFSLDGKGLTILAVGSGTHLVVGQVRVSNSTPAQFFGLRGFEVSLAGSSGGVVEFSQCAGTAWIEDCSIEALGVPPIPETPPAGSNNGVLATDCDNVVLVRTTVSGQKGSAILFGEPRAALETLRSTVSVYESVLLGPDGADAELFFNGLSWNCSLGTLGSVLWSSSQEGGRGARVEDSTFYAQGATFVGGEGGEGSCCVDGGDFACGIAARNGGPGLEVLGTSDVQLLDVTQLGGAGAPFLPCGLLGPPGANCSAGDDGAPSVGAVTVLAGTARSLQLPSTVLIGGAEVLQVQGVLGDDAYAVFSDDSTPFFWPQLQSMQVTRLPVSFVSLGDVPANGSLQTVFSLPPMLFGSGAQRRVVQGLFFGADGGTTLGSSSLVHLLP